MKFYIFQDAKKEWRWHLKARNGRIVAVSGEGYKRKVTMYKSMDAILVAFITDNYTTVET